jgi:hypothetical protein
MPEQPDLATFEDVAPVLPVRDLAVALERYRLMGFRVRAYGHGTGLWIRRPGPRLFHFVDADGPLHRVGSALDRPPVAGA